MTWFSVLVRTTGYLSLPFIALFRWLLVALSPVIHLAQYTLSGLLLPLSILGKFETLYIYLGVAAIIGLVTGSVLHLSSSLLVTLLNLSQPAEEVGRTAASVRAARGKKKLEAAWQSSTVTSRVETGRWNSSPSMEKIYAELLTSDGGKKREDGLRGSTILEEDDSDDGF